MLRSPAVLLVGLTGGIGAGKSTVASRLEDRGASIIDADKIVREIQAPGGIAYQPIIDRFGPGVVASDGTLDRPAIAAIVFSDDEARADLNKLTQPQVGRIMLERMAALRETDRIVVMDIPLLTARSRDGYGLAAVVVVDCPVEEAVRRLVAHRGFSEHDARARIAAQISREERLEMADFVVDNGGSEEALAPQIDACWQWLEDRRTAGAGSAPEEVVPPPS